MALIQGLVPPSKENWELLNWLWQFFPLFTMVQWFVDWYPQGKTSVQSKFNIPGKIGWCTMEAPGFMLLLYIMFTLPQENGIEKLPNTNWLLATLFTVHYLYRAVAAPLFLNPSMSPIHIFVWASAFAFQVINATCIGGWLAGYGPTTTADWGEQMVNTQVGLMLFVAGLFGNIFHDDELREIRRQAMKEQEERSKTKGESGGRGVDKVYRIPRAGLFEYILFPHYLCEWIEWLGYWVIGGLGFVPARSFLLNEIATMSARAVQGKRWYVERFGKEAIGTRKAVIPGLL